MSRNVLPTLLLVATINLIFLTPALAHRVRVFAFEQDGTIITEAKFNSGRPAKEAAIIVKHGEGERVLLTGTTDDQGSFSFLVPDEAKNNRLDLKIILDAGGGHQGSWLLKAEDYLPQTGAVTVPSMSTTPATSMNEQNTSPSSASSSAPENEILQRLIKQTIAKEIAPIKRMLLEQQQQKITLQDILGGLGYILGLAGIAAYFQAKRGVKQ
jgi:nickel transport protein